MVQRARYEIKIVALSSDWARKVAEEKWSAGLLAQFPTYTRGPRKGQPKGWLAWIKCTEGGWMRVGNARGGVLRPGTHGWCLTLGYPGTMEEFMRGAGKVASWEWNGGAPYCELDATPAVAEQYYKTHGNEARYA